MVSDVANPHHRNPSRGRSMSAAAVFCPSWKIVATLVGNAVGGQSAKGTVLKTSSCYRLGPRGMGGLRGHKVNPAQLEALRAVLATRSRQRRVLAHGWDEDGYSRLTVVVRSLNSPVISIPTSIARYVASRRFEARTREGTVAGVIGRRRRRHVLGVWPLLAPQRGRGRGCPHVALRSRL